MLLVGQIKTLDCWCTEAQSGHTELNLLLHNCGGASTDTCNHRHTDKTHHSRQRCNGSLNHVRHGASSLSFCLGHIRSLLWILQPHRVQSRPLPGSQTKHFPHFLLLQRIALFYLNWLFPELLGSLFASVSPSAWPQRRGEDVHRFSFCGPWLVGGCTLVFGFIFNFGSSVLLLYGCFWRHKKSVMWNAAPSHHV